MDVNEPPEWEKKLEAGSFGGFVLPVEDPNAEPVVQLRPAKPLPIPKCPWRGGWNAEQLARETAWAKKQANRKARTASKFHFEAHKDDQGKCWLVVVGPKVFFASKRKVKGGVPNRSGTVKMRRVDAITISLLSQEFGEPKLNSAGEVLFKREIGWPLMAEIPQYE